MARVTKKTTTVKKVARTVKKAVTSKVVKKKAAKVIKTRPAASGAKRKGEKQAASHTGVTSVVRGLVTTVVGVDGNAKGKMTLPREVFGEKVNKQLIAQAVRVYLANQLAGGANTKPREEVAGD